MRVLFLASGDVVRASSRYRVYNLIPLLEERGYDCRVIVKPGITFAEKAKFAAKLAVEAARSDVLYIGRVLLPTWYLGIVSRLVDTIIYDFDDALYSAPPGDEPVPGREPRLQATLSRATVTITGSPVLSEYAREFIDAIECLPTSIPREPYEDARETADTDTSDSVTLGWIGNPENLAYLVDIEDVLRDVLDANDDLSLDIITAGEQPHRPLAERVGRDVFYREWSLADELKLLSTANIGIRPLRDDRWTRGKGGFTSVVQCMGLGMPVVVTPVGMLSSIVEHGETGYHATTPSEWRAYLTRLADDVSLRREMGDAAFESLGEQRFWLDQRVEDVAGLLDTVGEAH
jgi:glycosyltransferase involved in cell wall biosynthesis